MDKTNRTAARALAAARLAASAEQIGSHHEARTAGATAGRLARLAGVTLDYLATEVRALMTLPGDAWESMVDAYYEAAA